MNKTRFIAALFLCAIVTTLAVCRHTKADASDALRADAGKIDGDIQQLQQDDQKFHSLVDPDKKAVAAAQQAFDQQSAPLEAQLKADEQALADKLKGRRQAVKSARAQGEAPITALEAKRQADEQRAKRDKSLVPQVEQEKAQIKAAREKLEEDLKSLEGKLAADKNAGEQALAAERQAMKDQLKDVVAALHGAQRKLNDDLLWQTKVDADKATLDADRQKLAADKAAAGE